MKERVLEMRKQILPMKDEYEFLNYDEREELKHIQEEHDYHFAQLSEEDVKWYEDELAKWYSRYLDVETKIFIKPCEG